MTSAAGSAENAKGAQSEHSTAAAMARSRRNGRGLSFTSLIHLNDLGHLAVILEDDGSSPRMAGRADQRHVRKLEGHCGRLWTGKQQAIVGGDRWPLILGRSRDFNRAMRG